jgi:TolB-like protein/Tfp pilus assembly protein PilF
MGSFAWRPAFSETLRGEEAVNPQNFFGELKRRNVYKVAVAYAVVGWLLIQVATQVFPFLEIPNWAIRLVILITALGFPVALIIAWAFELTPEGLKRTEFADKLPKKSSGTRVWLYVVVLASALSVSLFFLGRYTAPTKLTGSTNTAAKSIAVLPFANLSEDKANAYFADGIQEEILTRLAKIADLKVISRTSTQRYQSKPGNLSEIAKQLDVANILEGSVQKAGDTVRVSVNLIQAASDSHLWADTYDRKLTDVLSVESEIAKAIAEQLQAKLTGREEQALAVKPTNNPGAYDAYLRGLAFEARGSFFDTATKTAIDSYERAVQLDPNFALAWARLSRLHAFLYFGADRTATRRDGAKGALDTAQKLQPNSPETLLALGYYQYRVLRDYGLAKTTFSRVSKILPGNSEVPRALGLIARREGHWDESIAYFEQALVLDPRNMELLTDAAGTYATLRQFPTAVKFYDRALDISPNEPSLLAAKAIICQAEGNLEQAARFLSEITVQTQFQFVFIVKITQLRLERNYAEAVRLLQARQAQFHFASEIEKGINQELLAWYQRFAGDTAGANVTAEQARNTLEPLYKDQQDSPAFTSNLAWLYGILGNKELALKEAERAVMLLPTAKDRVTGPAFEENLAVIQTMFGEKSRAISTLTHLLQMRYGSWLYQGPITPALLRLDPLWDPLRSDPAFQKLCEEKQP